MEHVYDINMQYLHSTMKNTLNIAFGVPKFEIKKVIFNPPATIVLWEDGTKTVVKTQLEIYDPEKGLAMAISKKALGNKGNYYNEFNKWLEDAPEELETEVENYTIDQFIKYLDEYNKRTEEQLKAWKDFVKEEVDD